jgi:MFS family permease
VLSFVVFPAPLLLVPLAGGPTPVMLGLLFAAEFLSGLGVMMLDITAGSVQTAVIPDALRARVAGAHRTINYGIRPVGALLGGALGGPGSSADAVDRDGGSDRRGAVGAALPGGKAARHSCPTRCLAAGRTYPSVARLRDIPGTGQLHW